MFWRALLLWKVNSLKSNCALIHYASNWKCMKIKALKFNLSLGSIKIYASKITRYTVAYCKAVQAHFISTYPMDWVCFCHLLETLHCCLCPSESYNLHITRLCWLCWLCWLIMLYISSNRVSLYYIIHVIRNVKVW